MLFYKTKVTARSKAVLNMVNYNLTTIHFIPYYPYTYFPFSVKDISISRAEVQPRHPQIFSESSPSYMFAGLRLCTHLKESSRKV